MSRGAERFTFDDQAADFDRRAGLPAGAVRRVAAAVRELAGGGLVLDVGAGTGEIGADLAGGRGRYVALDLSGAMLVLFRRKLGAGVAGSLLVRADAAVAWPLAGGRAAAVFLSRAAHLLAPEHLVAETLRVADPAGAVLVLGSVRREPGSRRVELRRQLHRLLAEHGVAGRSGRRARRRIVAALEERGGRRLPPRIVASWPVTERAAESLAAWRGKAGLAGRPVAPEIRDILLGRLEAWARERYGDLETAHPSTEHYELEAVRLDAH